MMLIFTKGKLGFAALSGYFFFLQGRECEEVEF